MKQVVVVPAAILPQPDMPADVPTPRNPGTALGTAAAHSRPPPSWRQAPPLYLCPRECAGTRPLLCRWVPSPGTSGSSLPHTGQRAFLPPCCARCSPRFLPRPPQHVCPRGRQPVGNGHPGQTEWLKSVVLVQQWSSILQGRPLPG